MKGYMVFIRRIVAIRLMLRDKCVPIWKRLLLLIGIIYIVLPIGIIPFFLFAISWIDDLIVAVLILWGFGNDLDRYWRTGGSDDFPRKFKKKNIIRDVEFEVRQDED